MRSTYLRSVGTRGHLFEETTDLLRDGGRLFDEPLDHQLLTRRREKGRHLRQVAPVQPAWWVERLEPSERFSGELVALEPR